MRFVYAVLFGGAIAIGCAAWWMLHTMNNAAGQSTSPVQFTVARGEQLRHIAVRLEEQKLIYSAGAWTLYALSTGHRSSIQAGQYVVKQSMTGKELLTALSTNPLKDNEVEVTIHEGLTLPQIAQELGRQGVVEEQVFLNLAQHPVSAGYSAAKFRIASQKPASVDYEGYLFPDTYRFFKHSTPTSVLDTFLKTLDARYTPALEASTRAAGHTPHEILTMASILEKEGNNTADWGMIADIFWRRIKIGMALQSDATVNYGLGKSNQTNTSIVDTQTPSPYNTYLNKGLPPGPIDNPGVQTIMAAITPTPNDNLYFLTASGKAVFAKTYEQHMANKQQFLR